MGLIFLFRVWFICLVFVLSVLIYILYSGNRYIRLKRFLFKFPVRSFFSGLFFVFSFLMALLVYLYFYRYMNCLLIFSWQYFFNSIILLCLFLFFIVFVFASLGVVVLMEVALTRVLFFYGIYSVPRSVTFWSAVFFVMTASFFEYSFYGVLLLMTLSSIYTMGAVLSGLIDRRK